MCSHVVLPLSAQLEPRSRSKLAVLSVRVDASDASASTWLIGECPCLIGKVPVFDRERRRGTVVPG